MDLNVFTSFEDTLREIAPILLLVPGVILVAAGLFLWLGGLRLLRPLAAFCAAAAGLVCALTFTGREWVPMVLFVIIPAAIALFVEKPTVVLLGASLAFLAILIVPLCADQAVRQEVVERAGPVPAVENGVMFETAAYVRALSEWTARWGRAFWKTTSNGRKTAAAAGLISVVLAGIIAWRWVCAITCSTLGTGMILVGLVVLVLSKGPQTLSYLADIQRHAWFVLGGMIVAGTLLNRWLCPVKVNLHNTKKPHIPGDEK